MPGKVKSRKNPRNKTAEKHFIAIFIFSLKLNTQKKICVAPEFKMKNLNWNALKFSEKIGSYLLQCIEISIQAYFSFPVVTSGAK